MAENLHYIRLTQKALRKVSAQSVWGILVVFLAVAQASNYYVSALTGNDYNTGRTPSTPLYSINAASRQTRPGDTVFVMNGTYRTWDADTLHTVVTIATSGSPEHWIVFKNYKNHKPIISFKGWSGVRLENSASYIEINGFTIRGNNRYVVLNNALNQPHSCRNPKPDNEPYIAQYNGTGISTDGRKSQHSHHLRILNNCIYDCGESGISLIQADYITIEKNRIFNNCWYSVFGGSGISLGQLWNYDDNKTNYHNFIINNTCFGNRLYVPVSSDCAITDGNGIIVDDSKNTQCHSAIGAYYGRTLIAHNIVFNNGGSGIHSFLSEHVDIINNTAYKNQQSPEINHGEIYAFRSNDVTIYNNILFAENAKAINAEWDNKNVVYDYNIYWNGGKVVTPGKHSMFIDPLFKTPTKDAAKADFHLKPASPAIGKGLSYAALVKLKMINPSKTTIGAYQ